MLGKKKGNEKDKVVELKQLVAQPQCLKLLILHTPFNINLDSLYQCINLVKLDLSKNNLSSFPYLGDLTNLKFMFIHQNKLDIDSLIGIFQQNVGKETRSNLSKSIIWVTYWGNKSQFNGRHYLINHTAVLAVDNHIVVPEERSEGLDNYTGIEPFCEATNISQILQNKKKFNKQASEEEYMGQFWDDMRNLRKRYLDVNPIIKIQKVFRGWIFRLKEQRRRKEKVEKEKILRLAWGILVREKNYSKKLKAIFKKKDLQYLLLPIKQMKLESAKRKMMKFVQQVKNKIILRKMNLRSQYKFFNVLKSNQQALRSLYNVLHIDDSSYLMIHCDGIKDFQQFVLPVACSMNNDMKIQITQNREVHLRYLYESSRKRREFLRLLELNQKSIAVQIKQFKERKIAINQSLYQTQNRALHILSSSPGIHFSAKQKQKMVKIAQSMRNKNVFNLHQFKKVSNFGNRQLLRDIVRGVYFYNMGYLTNCKAPTTKINFLSEYSIKKTTAILKIQKMWRGFILRKRIKNTIRINFIHNKAAKKIQRWYRNLPWNHRKIFMFDTAKLLKSFKTQYFYVRLDEYMSVVNKIWQETSTQSTRITFLQQNICPYINKESKKLLLSWNSDSKDENSYICSEVNKKLFTQDFIKKNFDSWEFAPPFKSTEYNLYEKLEISHLFHYLTQISTISRKSGSYLEIKCESKYDCRLRVLGLKLLTYRFNHRSDLTIVPKQYLNSSQMEVGLKKLVRNPNSVFISQINTLFDIQPVNLEKAKKIELQSKFYIPLQKEQKPVKFITTLKIVLIQSQEKEVYKKNQLRSLSHHQPNIDIENFLITETKEVRLNRQMIKQATIDQVYNIQQRKRNSYKNIKIERKLKIKNKNNQFQSAHIEMKQRPNFMLGDPHSYQRLTTQPDLFTHERSLASIIDDSQDNKQMLYKSDKKVISQPKEKTKKRLIKNDDIHKEAKKIDAFTKNFINQGNFIQSQFLYGQIRRIKTEFERDSIQKVQKIKTELNEGKQYLNHYNEQKLKRAQESHEKHKQQLLRNAIDSQEVMELKIKKKQQSESMKYKSMPKRMRINFAEQCYPIIGSQPKIFKKLNEVQ